jgi:hypothetical protein
LGRQARVKVSRRILEWPRLGQIKCETLITAELN